MVVLAVAMTGVVAPMVTMLYKPCPRQMPYKQRNMERLRGEGELRVLACVHGPHKLPAVLSVVEAANATKRSPIFLYALHLVELTGRSSAMLIVHNTRHRGRPALSRTQAQSDHIVAALEHFEQFSPEVSVQPLTTVSPYATMHEDICALAQDKHVALILLPFHKELTVDGTMEATNPIYRSVNQNVLSTAPCSVAILIDRGLGTPAVSRHHSHLPTYQRIVVLFFGGADDREAFCLAARMAERPGCHLTLVRFLPSASASPSPADANDRCLDDALIDEFRYRLIDNKSGLYIERVVNNGEEAVSAVCEIIATTDLFILGRSKGAASPLTAGLADWSECTDLGAMGDVLASSDFSSASVLIIQQYVGGGELEVQASSEVAGEEMVEYLQTPQRPTSALGSTPATARSTYVGSPTKP